MKNSWILKFLAMIFLYPQKFIQETGMMTSLFHKRFCLKTFYTPFTQLLSERGVLQAIQELFFLTNPDIPPIDDVVTVFDRV